MAEFDDTNRGAIWPSKRKAEAIEAKDPKAESYPDFEGNVNVGGVQYWVSAWKRKPGANPKSPSLSFTVKPKDQPKPYGNSGPTSAQKDADMADEIPY